MLRKNTKIDYLRSIMKYYWGLSSNKVQELKDESPLYYYQGIKSGISFTKNVDKMDYLDLIIISERILENPFILKLVKTGNLTVLDEDFMIDYFFKLCREKLSEYRNFSLSHSIDKIVDKSFNINMYNTSRSELNEIIGELHKIDIENTQELWELDKKELPLATGALKHLNWLLIMKSRGYRITDWAPYLFKRGLYKQIEGEFDPRLASKEIGILYFDQFVLR